MIKESLPLLSEDEALARVERDRAIDGYFTALSRTEQPEAKGLDVEYLIQILVEAGADLETPDLVEARESLAKTKYTEAHPNRRPGVVAVWGEEPTSLFETWSQNVSVEACPRFTDRGKSIEGSQSRGLKQLLADLTEMAIRGRMTVEDFVRRTDIRVRRGIARKNKTEGPESDLAMIPDGSLSKFWNSVRSGRLPK